MIRSLLSNALIVFAYVGITSQFHFKQESEYFHVLSVITITVLIFIQDYLTEYVGYLTLKRLVLNLVMGIAAQSLITSKYAIVYILILAIAQDLLTIGQIKGKTNVVVLCIITFLMFWGWLRVSSGLLKVIYESNIDVKTAGKLFFNSGEVLPVMIYFSPPIMLAILFAWLVGKNSN